MSVSRSLGSIAASVWNAAYVAITNRQVRAVAEIKHFAVTVTTPNQTTMSFDITSVGATNVEDYDIYMPSGQWIPSVNGGETRVFVTPNTATTVMARMTAMPGATGGHTGGVIYFTVRRFYK
jgi:hypothetical protein